MKKLVKVLFLVFAVNAFTNSHSNAFNLIGTISSFFYCNKTHLSDATNSEILKQLINNFYNFAKNSPEQGQKLLLASNKLRDTGMVLASTLFAMLTAYRLRQVMREVRGTLD